MAVIEEGYSEGEVKTFEQQYAGAVDIKDGRDTIAAQFVAAKEYIAAILAIQQGLEALAHRRRRRRKSRRLCGRSSCLGICLRYFVILSPESTLFHNYGCILSIFMP